jgi:hypothetical protein
MKRFLRPALTAIRTLLLCALVATTFSSCALLGAAIQLVGKAVKAFAGNTADSIPMRLNMSVPIRAEEGSVVGTSDADGDEPAR